MEWVVRASKDPNENVENQDFDNKNNKKKKISECNDMKGDKGKLLSESDEKDNFDRKNYTKLLNVNEGW